MMTASFSRRAFDQPSPSPTPSGPDRASWALGAATIAGGLMAGTYFAFSVAVLPGLVRSDDRTFVEAMQEINLAIQNPVFFAIFFGALALPAVAAILLRRSRDLPSGRWAWAALALCGLAFATTVGFNVPLNDRLAAAGTVGHIADLASVRHQFEIPWIIGNTFRAIVSTASVGCLGRALLLHGRIGRTRSTGIGQ